MATTTMSNIERALGSVIKGLSGENYAQSLAQYRFLFCLAQTYSQIPPDVIFDSIWNQIKNGGIPSFDYETLYPTSPLIFRFASDVESDSMLASHCVGLRNRLCASILKEFFDDGLGVLSGSSWNSFLPANLIAHGANLGYIEEDAIREHILQFLTITSGPALHDNQAHVLRVIFKIAGATFSAYAHPSVVDRCFELLKSHPQSDRTLWQWIQVSKFCEWTLAGAKTKLQEVIELREHGWEGLPPPPVLIARGPERTSTGQGDPSATPVATPLGLPNIDLEPRIPPSHPIESVTAPETEITSVSPVTQSPSISIASLSDFTIADASDDESPIDPTTISPHDTFNFEDGNVEVLCRNTLFRVHTSILSLHSPALRQMFAQTNLAAAESPNGCPRILSSDTAADFATLLKMIYLPGYVYSPSRRSVPLTDHSQVP